jgi:hypothetical protein
MKRRREASRRVVRGEDTYVMTIIQEALGECLDVPVHSSWISP